VTLAQSSTAFALHFHPDILNFFLQYEDVVWKSYGDTIKRYGIHAIPYFVFSVPELGMVGGPFRAGQGEAPTPWIVNGSMDSDRFLKIFSEVYNLWKKLREEAK
jgi:hypothetical protein